MSALWRHTSRDRRRDRPCAHRPDPGACAQTRATGTPASTPQTKPCGPAQRIVIWGRRRPYAAALLCEQAAHRHVSENLAFQPAFRHPPARSRRLAAGGRHRYSGRSTNRRVMLPIRLGDHAIARLNGGTQILFEEDEPEKLRPHQQSFVYRPWTGSRRAARILVWPATRATVRR